MSDTADQEPKPSKCFFDMWQGEDNFIPVTASPCPRIFYVELRVNFIVEYTSINRRVNVRSEKLWKILRCDKLLDDSKNRNTISSLIKFFPVQESDMENIINVVSSKTKIIDSDGRNSGRIIIPVVMSLRVYYSQEFDENLLIVWSSRFGIDIVAATSVPALATAVKELDTVTYHEGCGLVEQCTVCLIGFSDGDKITRMPCYHDFHANCIGEWLKQSSYCPICRFPLPICHRTEDLCPFKDKITIIVKRIFRFRRIATA